MTALLCECIHVGLHNQVRVFLCECIACSSTQPGTSVFLCECITCGSAQRTGQQFDDLLHLLLEADVENPVGLVDHQTLQVLVHELGRVLQTTQRHNVARTPKGAMEQSTGRTAPPIHAIPK